VPDRNLFLVPYDDAQVPANFEEIARRARQSAPDLRVEVVRDRRYRVRRLGWARRPSYFFSPVVLKRLRPLRGHVAQGANLPKSAQLAPLERAGIRVPRWTVVRQGEPPDLEGFDPYVVVKPDLGRRGAWVRVMRRNRVRWRQIDTSIGHAGSDLLVQEFIYTGPWPVSYRVLTLYGEPLYCMRSEANHRRPPLRGRYAFDEGVSIVSTARDAFWSLADDADVLALARRAAAAMPDPALLGIDMIREDATGHLYVLETNPLGWTWHLGSASGLSLQHGFGFDACAQFGALETAARVLVGKARELAC